MGRFLVVGGASMLNIKKIIFELRNRGVDEAKIIEIEKTFEKIKNENLLVFLGLIKSTLKGLYFNKK